MTVVQGLTVVDSRYQAAAHCVVCRNDVLAGEGVTAQYQGRLLRFRCPDCFARFELDPERYLSGHETGCCEPADSGSPPSEWRYE